MQKTKTSPKCTRQHRPIYSYSLTIFWHLYLEQPGRVRHADRWLTNDALWHHRLLECKQGYIPEWSSDFQILPLKECSDLQLPCEGHCMVCEGCPSQQPGQLPMHPSARGKRRGVREQVPGRVHYPHSCLFTGILYPSTHLWHYQHPEAASSIHRLKSMEKQPGLNGTELFLWLIAKITSICDPAGCLPTDSFPITSLCGHCSWGGKVREWGATPSLSATN